MAGEAKRKSAFEFTCNVGIKQRTAISNLLSAGGICAKCGAAPLPTGDPQKFARVIALIDALKLGELDGVSFAAMEAIVVEERAACGDGLPGIPVAFKADTMRLFFELITDRAWMLGSGAIPFRHVLAAAMPPAAESGIKPRGIETVNMDADDESASINLTPAERATILRTYRSPRQCPNPVAMMDGSVGFHGAPIDNPKTLADILTACRAHDSIALQDLDADADLFAAEKNPGAPSEYEIEKRSLVYLHAMLIRRTETMGVFRLAPLIAKLDAALKAIGATIADTAPETAPPP